MDSNHNNLSYERNLGLDLTKILAVFLIILYHLNLVDFGFVKGETYFPSFTKIIWTLCTAGVPLFFIVNGALTIPKKYAIKKVLNKAVRLIFVAIVWGIISFLIIPFIDNSKMTFSIGAFINSYWFLYTLSALYLINYFLGQYNGKIRLAVVVFIIIFPFVTNFVWDLVLLFSSNVNLPNWGHTGFFTLYSIIYQSLGFFLIGRHINKGICIIMILIGVFLVSIEVFVMTRYNGVLYDGVNSSFPTIGALLISVGLYSIIRDIKVDNILIKRYISFLSRNALGIYVLHIIIVSIFRFIFFPGITLHPLYVFVISALVLNICALLSELIRISPMSFILKI